MLKALELVGFKSFADKTRFEFPAGITVVVGPNGSGKSNVVDAIKWVLGEQSVKSLRGKEMADVIFKGSPSGGRKPMNFAEATIVFENPDSRLPVESAEVRVTRRVYRSGEGEYLINGQACRLKDIRDLFRGTGVGTDAYSLIEQGKVDRMLQASPKERRSMFEEAAGISRFKAKKLETQRRLERVAQNLLRLADIVDEVESRLRTVRSQATKARQYREHQQRLHELRMQVGLSDWQRYTHEREAADAKVAELRESLAAIESELAQADAENLAVDQLLDERRHEIEESEQLAARKHEAIAVCRSRAQQLVSQFDELTRQRMQLQKRLVLLKNRAGDVDDRLAELCTELSVESEVVEQQRADVRLLAVACERARRDAHRLGIAGDRWNALLAENTSLAAKWKQRREHADDEWRVAVNDYQRAREALADAAHEQAQALRQRDVVAQEIEWLNQRLDAAAGQYETLRVDQEEEERLWSRRQEELIALQNRLSGLRERTDLLTELERKREGVGAGPREVLRRAAESRDGPYHDVVGLVGDSLDVPLEIAPLVDNVLGPLATAVILRRGASLIEWSRLRDSLPGRVHLLPLDELAGRPDDALPELPEYASVERLADCVSVPAELESLRTGLLGGTYLVDNFDEALRLHSGGFSGELVARSGEQVHRDGSIVLGPGTTSANLVSRRSELRVLTRGVQTVGNQIAMAEDELSRLRARVDARQSRIANLERELSRLKEQLADQRVSLLTLDDQLQRLRRVSEAESQAVLDRLCRERVTGAARMRAGRLADLARRQAAAAAWHLDDVKRNRRKAEQRAAAAQEELRQAEVALARREEWLASLEQQRDRIETDRMERVSAVEETATQVTHTSNRLDRIELSWLDAHSQMAADFWNLQALHASAARRIGDRESLLADQHQLSRRIDKLRRSSRRIEQQLQQHEMEARQWQQQLDQLEQRYQDDFQIDLAQLVNEGAVGEDAERTAIEEEITQLRHKIAGMGAVNMEALEELDSLEERFATLSGQYQDMVQAKSALERIIQKINADSRRLFVETLEAIRSNFQQLYRKSFGGGHADLVVEEGVDILEAGIDIVATPPGKPSFNNSLLSGGERALTAVALLLAIFQYRPSPFCVLDEVDAPFDEANIGRFVDVLKDFLGWTRFVVVTHSKKTMTAADTLYGITMQESGVSKQVSVRFEDVREGGEIRPSADDASPDDEQAA